MTHRDCRSRRDPRSAAFGTGPGTPPPAWLTPGHRIAVRGRIHVPAGGPPDFQETTTFGGALT